MHDNEEYVFSKHEELYDDTDEDKIDINTLRYTLL